MDGNRIISIENNTVDNILSRNGPRTVIQVTKPAGQLHYDLRPNQIKNLHHMSENNYTLNVGPTGSGKSLTMLCYGANELKQNRICIIIIPKLSIASAFKKYNSNNNFTAVGGGIQYVLQPDDTTTYDDDKVESFISGIKGLHQNRLGRVFVCSYQVFYYAMPRLTREELQCYSLLVDETHHSNTDPEEGTCLGSAVDTACDIGMNVHLFTATDFRSDGGPIVPPMHAKKFKKHKLTTAEHYINGGCPDFCIHVECYDRVSTSEYDTYDNSKFSGDTVRISRSDKLIKKYVTTFMDNRRPTLMITPATMKFDKDDKIQTSAQFNFALVNALKKADNNISILNLGSRDGFRLFSVLPASVTSAEYAKLDERDVYDVVTSIKVADEGMDWPDCEQIFCPGISGSLQLTMQRIGRTLRMKSDPNKKSHAWFFEMGILTEDKPMIARSLFRLALRLKSVCFGHDWRLPIELDGVNRDGADESKGLVYDLPYDIQTEIDQKLHDKSCKSGISEMISTIISEINEYDIKLNEVAAAELLIEKGILVEKSSLKECKRLNYSIGRAAGDFGQFCEYLEANYNISDIRNFYGMLSNIADYERSYKNYQEEYDGETRATKKLNELCDWMDNHGGEKPNGNSEDLNERSLIAWLTQVKQAKKGIIGRTWYPILLEIAIERGYPNLFEIDNLEQLAINRLNELCDWMDNHNKETPNNNSKNQIEKQLARWLSGTKKSKKGKGKWYPILLEIAIERGYPNLFENENLEQLAIKWMNELCNWINNHGGRKPNQHSKDQIEKSLSAWLTKTKQSMKGNGKWYSILLEIAIERGYPTLFEIDNLEQIAINKLNELCNWMDDRNKETPNNNSNNLIEKQLSQWLSKIKQSKKGNNKGIWYPILLEIAIERGYPTLFETENPEQLAIDKLNELCDWIDNHGKEIPSGKSKDFIERSLAQWLTKIKQARKGSNCGRIWYPILLEIAIERGYPDLFKIENLEQNVIDKLNKLCDWMDNHNRLPQYQYKDQIEKSLYQWISMMKKAKKNIGTVIWRPILLETAINRGYPTLFDTENFEQNAVDKLNELCDWMNNHGKVIPNKHSEDKIEKSLSEWLSGMRQAKKGKKRTIWYPILEKIAIKMGYPNLFETKNLEQNAVDKLNKLCDWMDNHGKVIPNKHSEDRTEKLLGIFLSGIRQAKKGGKTGRTWHQIFLKIAIKRGYSNLFEIKNLEQLSIIKLNELCDWMNNHKKTPNARSKNQIEKLLGTWLGNRKKDLRYPILLEIATKRGYPTLFETK